MTKYLGVYKDIIVHSLFFQEYYYVWDVIERVNLYMMQNSSSPIIWKMQIKDLEFNRFDRGMLKYLSGKLILWNKKAFFINYYKCLSLKGAIGTLNNKQIALLAVKSLDICLFQ